MKYVNKIMLVLTIAFYHNAYSGVSLENLSRMQEFSSLQLPQSPLENRSFSNNATSFIDEESYVIGCGDEFYISVVDVPSSQYNATVDLDGNLYIPELGIIKVGDVKLIEAKEIIRKTIEQKLNRKTDVYVTLTDAKSVAVSFTGKINFHGAKEFPGSTRLLDAIRIANSEKIPLFKEANIREISVVNRGTKKTYDLMQYLYAGDLSQNPYLFPGDRINVPPISKTVLITGVVTSPSPGTYPLKENETLKEFLSYFTFGSAADTAQLFIQRTSTGETKHLTSLIGEQFVLEDLDVITIPEKENHPSVHTVRITGEISRPGTYPIIENVTTARDIINIAGGANKTGNIAQAVIIRHSKSLSPGFSTKTQSMTVVRPELSTSLTMMSATSDHIVISLSRREQDITMEPSDQIYIPKLEKLVYVSGNVKQPGAYEYVKGQSNAYYIRQAGGLSRNADRSNIKTVMRYGEVYQLVDSGEIQPGNIVVVPASIQYRFFSTVVIPLVSAIATTLGVGLAIYNTTAR